MELRKHWYSIVDFFQTPLGCQIKFYALFYFFLWSLHLILISLISFFHLLLNHNIRTIGDWIGDRGWALIIFSKVLIFYISVQFIRLRSKKINLLQGYFRNSIQWPRKEFIVVLLFLLLGLMGIGQVKFNSSVILEIDRILLSAVGTLIFFGVDYSLVVVLETFYPITEASQKSRKLFIFPFLFYVFTYSTFIYEQLVSFRLYAFFFLFLYLGEWRRRNWTLPFYALFFFITPAYFLLGLDPVWGSSYSLFILQKPVSTFSLFILIGLAVGYLHYIQKNNPEYIYRD